MSETLTVREQIKSKLAEIEIEAETLKASLPSPFLTFFRFRLTRPRTMVMVYAGDEEEARDKVIRRLDSEYPDGYELHPRCDVYTDPQQANGNCSVSSTVFECLTREDANLFLSHCDEAESIPVSPACKNPEKPGKRKPNKTGLQRAADAYRRRLAVERLEVRHSRQVTIEE